MSQTEPILTVDLIIDNQPFKIAWESIIILLLQVIVTLKEAKLEKL